MGEGVLPSIYKLYEYMQLWKVWFSSSLAFVWSLIGYINQRNLVYNMVLFIVKLIS